MPLQRRADQSTGTLAEVLGATALIARDPALLADVAARIDDTVRARVAARHEALATLAQDTSPGATSDGHAVARLANIGTAEDAERLTGAAVEGVGLFRTEVLFSAGRPHPRRAGGPTCTPGR